MRRLPLNVRTALLYCGLVIAGYDTARLSITALASGIQALATVPAGGTGLTALTLNSLLAGNGTSPVQLIGNPNDNTQALCGSNPPAFGTTCKGSGGGGTPGSTYFTYVNATGVGPNNTAAETSLIGTATTGSKTIPANTFVAGSFTQAVVNGQITTPVVPNNLVLNMYMGATKIATGTITGTNIASLGTQSFILNVGMGTLTGGATCAMVIESASLVSGAIIGGTVVNFQGTGTTFDCTATQVFDVKAQWGMAQMGESVFGQVVTLYTPGAPVTSVQGLTGAITVTDANLSTSDVTTNDCGITKHGFAPKAPNDATKFLNGVCGYTVPAGGVPYSLLSIAPWTQPPLTGWTNDHSGSFDTTNGYPYISIPNLAATAIGFEYRTAPAAPYTCTALVYWDSSGLPPGTAALGGTATNNEIGVGFRDGTGKIEPFWINTFASNSFGLGIDRWTNSTTFGSTSKASNYTAFQPSGLSNMRNPFWFQWADNNTNLVYSWSVDGNHWRQFYTESRTAYFGSGPTQVGFGAFTGAGDAVLAVVSWSCL